ncbi:MAG: hypothetical protein QM775_05740 [Pirellulales bacterium]
MRLSFQFRFRTLLLLIAAAGVGFAIWRTLLIRNYNVAREHDDATLATLKAAFGEYQIVPRQVRGTSSVTVLQHEFRVVREVRRPTWSGGGLHLPDDVFLRTTQVMVAQIPTLAAPRLLSAPQGRDDLPSLPSHISRLLKLQASSAYEPAMYVDWEYQRMGLERAQVAYRALAELPELELLRPGLLFDDADLALFRHHPRLRVLCLLPYATNDGFFPAITLEDLQQLAEGFPALKVVTILDPENADSEAVAPDSAIGKLLARRPGLHVARYGYGLGLVWAAPLDPKTGTWRPIPAATRAEMDAVAPLLAGVDEWYPEVRYPGEPKKRHGWVW